MTAKYYALLTDLGTAKLANATALGTRLSLTQMAVGDGGGALPTPDPAQTALKGEKRRAALNSLSVDAANANQIIAEQIIPEDEGGFWIREIGLYDDSGTLIAVANCPETYKPQLQEGSGRTQTVRMILVVNSTDAVTLKIDPSVVLATRKYVDDKVIEVKAYVDNVMTKHLAAKDPHTQYLKTASQLSEIKAQGSTAMANALKNIGAMPFYATALNVDLDTLGPDGAGVYYKETDSAATPELHYPEKMSGTLLVIPSGYGVQQEYTTRLGNKYVRGLTGTWNGNGPWRAWTPVYSSGNPPTAADVGALPVIATSIGNTSIDTYALDHLGIYQQSLAANVTTANGFPAAATAGGTLEVILGPYVGGVLQRYTEKHTGRTWSRTLTGNWNGSNGPWSAWAAMYSENNPPKASDVGALAYNSNSLSVDLNTLGPNSLGVYYKNGDNGATAALNYPYPVSGTLLVLQSGWNVQQEYTTRTGKKYVRGLTGTWNGSNGPWAEWMPVGDCPVGAPVPWPGAAAPTGWLKCNGASFSANTYPELAKAYPSLKLPDLRGEFIRGWDDGRGADSGRALLSAQSDAVGLNYGSTNVPKTIVVNIPRTSSGTDAMDGLEVGVGFADNGATSVSRLTAKTANETRPRNVAFNYIVRAA